MVKVSRDLSVYLWYLHQDLGASIRALQRRFRRYSVATIRRHATRKIPWDLHNKTETPKVRSGRKRKLSDRDKRRLVRTLLELREEEVCFSAKRIQTVSWLSHVHIRTIRRVLNRNGFACRQARRKGILSKLDTTLRLSFARKVIRNYDESLWTEGISFYLDGKSFVHKTNPLDQARAPSARVWRKKNDGLRRNCTRRGNKAGVGSRTAHFFISISYGKWVIACDPYEKLDGETYTRYVDNRFPELFRRSCAQEGNIFLQDGDPSQNSAVARQIMSDRGMIMFGIPPRSPDCNPIENFSGMIEKKLTEDAINHKITYESFEEFVDRVTTTMFNFPAERIDKIIESMPSRMHKLAQNGGERVNY